MKSCALLIVMILSALNGARASHGGSGLYFGAGGGLSSYRALLLNGDYTLEDTSSGSINTRGFNEQNGGYRIYGGYLFNKIVGVEAAYTDYGRMTSTNYEQEPFSASVAANLGYTFLEGQLRTFGLLGLAYVKTNQSRELLDEEMPALHFGLGVDYHPAALRGLGFRAAVDADMNISHQTAKADDGSTSLTSFYQHYLLLYAGIQYKF